MPTTSIASTAILLHLVDWKLSKPEVEIAPGIWLCCMQGSPVEQSYTQLSMSPQLQFDPESGEPFDFPSYVRFDSPPTEANHDFGDPYSKADRVCNFLTVLLHHPTYMARVVQSTDNFTTIGHSQVLYMYGIQSDFLLGNAFKGIDARVVRELSAAWAVSESVWPVSLAQARIANALAFFQYAWRADYLEHTCLNLATTLEILFAPHSTSETTHQISFNVAHFLAHSREDRISVYNTIKRFYSIRSSITHGGLPSPAKVEQPTVAVFNLCLRILRKILISPELSSTIEDDTMRKRMLQRFQFGDR